MSYFLELEIYNRRPLVIELIIFVDSNSSVLTFINKDSLSFINILDFFLPFLNFSIEDVRVGVTFSIEGIKAAFSIKSIKAGVIFSIVDILAFLLY